MINIVAMKKKLFRGSMSFDAVDTLGTLELDTVGIQMGAPVITAEAKLKIMESLGMFGDGNNSNQFYPEIKSAADVAPKPEDFVDVPFRLLSATIVGGGSWKATDFSDAAVLKGSMNMLSGKPVYKNHDMSSVDNWVGMIKAVSWTDQFMDASGQLVPAGIDGVLSIDAKTEPKIARGVLMGAIYSNSVTVEFDWEMSHHFENVYDFMELVGTQGTDGKMITRKVKNIYNYHETSLVFLGADPYAKQLDEVGNLKHIDVGSISYAKADAGEKKVFTDEHKMKIDKCIDKNVLSLSLSKLRETTSNNKNKETDMKYLLALAKRLGLDASAVTEENYESLLATLVKPEANASAHLAKAGLLDKVVTSGLEVASLSSEDLVKVTLTGENEAVSFSTELPADAVVISKADLVSLKATAREVDNLKTEKTELSANAEIGKKFLNLQREECVRLYKLNVGANVDEAVISLMQEAKPDALAGLLKMHTKGAGMKFSGSCKACGSEEFEFRSTVGSNEEDGKETESNSAPAVKSASFEDLYKRGASGSMNIRKN